MNDREQAAQIAEGFKSIFTDWRHDDMIDEIAAAIRALPDGWRDIAEYDAGKHNGRILCWNQLTGIYTCLPKDGEFPFHGWDNLEGVWYPRPTKWMPLPDAQKG